MLQNNHRHTYGLASSLNKNFANLKAVQYYGTFKKRQDVLKKSKYVKNLHEELANTSCGGLSYTVNQTIHCFERFFWTVCVVLSFMFAIYLITFQFVRFIRAPIVMSVEMDYFNWNISYPAFTLCPSLKYDLEAFAALVNETNNRTGKDMEPYLNTIVSVTMDNLGLVDLDFPPDVIKLIDPKEYAGLAMASFKKFDNTSLTTNTNWPIEIEEMMTEYGMCHVVNSNVAAFSNPKGDWNNDEAYQKKNIELSFHDQGFFVQVMDYADIYKVFIHSPDEPILLSTPSYTHSLKGFASFGVTIWSSKMSEELKKAPLALRRCRYISEPLGKRYRIYSYNFCMLECRAKMILKLCGCVPHFYKSLDSEPICSLTDLQCVSDHNKEISSLSISEKTVRKFSDKEGLPRNSYDCGCMNKCETDGFRKDYESFMSETSLNRLRIGISSFPKIRVVRDIMFARADAILKIGGIVNLCTGASFITIIELVVLFLRMPILYIFEKVKGNFLNKM